MSVTVTKHNGGYLIVWPMNESEIVTTTEALFARLLGHFEGRYQSMSGDHYGRITIERERPR